MLDIGLEYIPHLKYCVSAGTSKVRNLVLSLVLEVGKNRDFENYKEYLIFGHFYKAQVFLCR